MINEGKFGVTEAVCLVTVSISSRILLASPSYVTRTLGTATWQMTLISAMITMVFFAFIYILLKRFPGKNIVEIYDLSLGRIIGFIFSFILMAFFLASAGMFMREFMDVLKVYVLPDTPISLILGSFVIVVTIAAFLGLETIARSATMIGYFSLFGYILLLLLGTNYYKVSHIFPILGYGIDRTFATGLMRCTVFEAVLVLAVFAGSLQGIKHIKKAGFISLALSGLIIASGTLCTMLTFEYTGMQEVVSPLFELSRIIKYGTFFERMDPLFLFIWILVTVITISILFYSSLSIYCQIFRMPDNRPVIIPMVILLFSIAILPRNVMDLITNYYEGLTTYGNIVFFILPMIALIVAILRKKRGEVDA